jgi:transposase
VGPRIRPRTSWLWKSTGIYWKSPYAALEQVGLAAWVVNARHVKNVPGRKTDISDAQWLATLARAGLVRASFIPPAEIRHLRLIARQRQKLGGMLASEKNRLHKVLADAGIRLNVLVSDLHGQSARAMIQALLDDQPIHAILDRAGRLRASREDLFEALQPEELSAKHRFVLNEILAHIEYLEATMARFEQQLLDGLAPWEPQLCLLETVPGIDRMGAAMLLVEIGTDMDSFGSAERLASWVGICPGNHESAGKRKSGRTRKGNAWVRRLLCEFAQAASRTRCALKDKFLGAVHPQGTQALHRRPGAQDAAHRVCHARPCCPLPGSQHRLRGPRGATQCAALVEDAGQARLHRHRLTRSAASLPPIGRPLRTGMRHARMSLAPTSGSFTLTRPAGCGGEGRSRRAQVGLARRA